MMRSNADDSAQGVPTDEVPTWDHHLLQGSSLTRLILLPGDALDEPPAGEGGSVTTNGRREKDPKEWDFAATAPNGRRESIHTGRKILRKKDKGRGKSSCQKDRTPGKNPMDAGLSPEKDDAANARKP